MSLASVTSTRCTTWPLMSRPRIAPASCAASSAEPASFTPPALPRPPVLTCAFTTTGTPIRAAATRACSGVSATSPGSTGTACAAKSSFAWYSYRSTDPSLHAEGTARPAGPAEAVPAPEAAQPRPARRRLDPGAVLAWASVGPALVVAGWLLAAYPLALAGRATPGVAVPVAALVV